MREIIRECIWCSAPMKTLRASKKVCSTLCQNALAYQNRKLYKMSSIEFTSMLEKMIKRGNHINPEHPLYSEEK